ncbi:MAG: regulatory protein RecX [Pseudobdellovibrionaceae bacterium]|jgi:regulatory protein|nr:regulatory protein RecX [Pseudobdellovibrionaceae bacterium]
MNKAFSQEKSSPQATEKPEKADSPLKKRKKISQSYLENSAAYYLQRFTASTSRFRLVMKRKIDLSCRDHPEQNKEQCYDMLDQLVSKFQELGYLNDSSYSKGLHYSLSQRGYSRQKIRFHMMSKGLSEDMITEAMGDTDQASEIIQGLRYAKRKKIGPFAIQEQDLQKSLASLARNGFRYDISTKILEMNQEEALSLLDEASSLL